MKKVDDIIRRVEKMKGDRATWEAHWEDVSTFAAPRYGGVVGIRPKGSKRMERVFDTTAMDANDTFAAGMFGHLCSGKWFTLKGKRDDEIADEWFSEATRILLEQVSMSNFGQIGYEMFKKLGVIGTACLLVEPGDVTTLNFREFHIGSFFIMENDQGLIDTVYRRFKYTARQAVQDFGLENVGHSVLKAYQDSKKRDEEFEFIHAVFPRNDRDSAKLDRGNMVFESLYIAVKDKHLIEESGFPEMPFIVVRLEVESGEVYGRSIGMKKLPEVKLLNKKVKLRIKAFEKKVDPPLQIPDDGFIMPLRTTPGGINYYRANTNDRIQPLVTDIDLSPCFIIEEGLRKSINHAWYVDLFALLADTEKATMTATEVMEKVEEKLILLMPLLGRLQAEWFDFMIARCLALLIRVGLISEPPEGIETYEVEYMGKLAIALKLGEIKSFNTAMNYIGPMEETHPEVTDVLNRDAIAKGICRRMALPEEWLNDEVEIEAIREVREQQMLAQQALEAAPGLSKAVEPGSPAAEIMKGVK
jgi:hypothetical protein